MGHTTQKTFTAGEWVVKTKDGNRFTRVETNDEFCYTICDCYNDEVKPYEMIHIEQAEANAILISEAKNMFYALKDIYDYMQGGVTFHITYQGTEYKKIKIILDRINK